MNKENKPKPVNAAERELLEVLNILTLDSLNESDGRESAEISPEPAYHIVDLPYMGAVEAEGQTMGDDPKRLVVALALQHGKVFESCGFSFTRLDVAEEYWEKADGLEYSTTPRGDVIVITELAKDRGNGDAFAE